jgi:plasmid stability protein
MASITIDGLGEAIEERLRVRAARHGRSIEEEAREILKIGVATDEQPGNLADSIRARFEPLGGFELPEFPGRKDLPRKPPSFD